MIKSLSAALAVLSFASAAHAGPKEDILAADCAFSQLSAEKGSNAAFLAYIAEDGRIFGTGNEKPIIGKAEATKRFTDPKEGNGDPKANVLRWEPDAAGVSSDGALGWSDGRWTFNGGDADHPIHLTGHYLTVWVKDAKGAWKVQDDMGTTDPQPERKL